jgi:hypothetical protein
MPNHDELMAQMAADELQDRLELTSKMSVVEYARAKGEQPQLLYYYIRTGKIEVERCICGRKVIDVKSADAFLAERDRKAAAKAGGVPDSQSGS